MGTGELHPDAGPLEPLDRLTIKRLGRLPVGHQRARAGLDAKRPVGGTGRGCLRKPSERIDRELDPPAPGGRLDQLDQPPRREPDLKRVLGGLLRRSERVLIAVYRYALVMLGSSADAEDVTQTTFLNAYRALQRGDRPRAAGTWLRTIAHNLCLQHFRHAARRPQQVQLVDEPAVVGGDEEGVVLDDLVRALRQIPVNQRAALVMRELEGRPIGEIASILSISLSAVETLLFRARRSVREQLEGSLTCAQAEEAISRGPRIASSGPTFASASRALTWRGA
jgi:RNA polymerase sigma-70 factor (ECF subfamily)